MGCEITTGEPLDIPTPMTGVRLGSLAMGAPGGCDPIPDPCVKFDLNSDTDVSAIFTVDEPMEMLAFGLEFPDYVELEQVWGPNEGTHFEAVTVGGNCFRLTPCSNRLLIPFAGRFRLRYVGDVGNATVVCNPTDCCFAALHPKDANVSCEPPLTNVQIAQMLALRTCSGAQVLPGEALVACTEFNAANAAMDARVDALEGVGPAPTYSLIRSNGIAIPSGSCVPTCADLDAAIAAIPAPPASGGTQLNFDTLTNVLTLQNTAGATLDTVSLAALAGGGGGGVADGVVTNVALVGTNLNFSGTGGGFNGTVSLAGLAAGADGLVSNVQLVGTNLVFTGTNGGFNGTISLAGLGGGGGASDGVITGVQLVGTNLVFTGVGGGFNGTISLASLVSNVDNTPAGNIQMRNDNVVPVGWALCDGTLGTPDLRGMFVRGASGTNAVGSTGGSLTHNHTGESGTYQLGASDIPEHFHYVASPTTIQNNLPFAPEGSIVWSNGNNPGEEEYELSSSGIQDASMGRTSLAGGAGAVTAHGHTIAADGHLPPHWSLIYIQKL